MMATVSGFPPRSLVEVESGFCTKRGRRCRRRSSFFICFNFIVLTTNLLVAQYLVAVSNFMLATLAALVVGKAVLVANKISLLKHYDRAPLVQPILFKTVFYWVVVFFARLLEGLVHFLLEGNAPADFFPHLITTFSWHRFLAISL